jgi:hypothetical protein
MMQRDLLQLLALGWIWPISGEKLVKDGISPEFQLLQLSAGQPTFSEVIQLYAGFISRRCLDYGNGDTVSYILSRRQ